MRTTSGNTEFPGVDAQRAITLNRLVQRWREALADVWESLLSDDLRRRILANRHDQHTPDCEPAGQLTRAADDGPEQITADPLPGDGETRERELVPLPTERSQALAVMCDRLLQDLDGAEVKAAEIRFVVHKHEDAGTGNPRLDQAWSADAGYGELVWELRRLIAWSGGTLADVAQALETRAADLDENARELLNDELAALEVDLATLTVHLADPVDWDTELGCLLAGEVAPFDDRVGDEDDQNDD
jgi:hypothetical protein